MDVPTREEFSSHWTPLCMRDKQIASQNGPCISIIEPTTQYCLANPRNYPELSTVCSPSLRPKPRTVHDVKLEEITLSPPKWTWERSPTGTVSATAAMLGPSHDSVDPSLHANDQSKRVPSEITDLWQNLVNQNEDDQYSEGPLTPPESVYGFQELDPGYQSDYESDACDESLEVQHREHHCRTLEEQEECELVTFDEAALLHYDKEERIYFYDQERTNHPDVARHHYRCQMGSLWDSAITILHNYFLDPLDLTESEFVTLVCTQGNSTSEWLAQNARKISNRRIQSRMMTHSTLRGLGISPRLLSDDFLGIFDLLKASEQTHFVNTFQELQKMIVAYEKVMDLPTHEMEEYMKLNIDEKAAFHGRNSFERAKLYLDATDRALATVKKAFLSQDKTEIERLFCINGRAPSTRTLDELDARLELSAIIESRRSFSYENPKSSESTFFSDVFSKGRESDAARSSFDAAELIRDHDAEVVRRSVVPGQVSSTRRRNGSTSVDTSPNGSAPSTPSRRSNASSGSKRAETTSNGDNKPAPSPSSTSGENKSDTSSQSSKNKKESDDHKISESSEDSEKTCVEGNDNSWEVSKLIKDIIESKIDDVRASVDEGSVATFISRRMVKVGKPYVAYLASHYKYPLTTKELDANTVEILEDELLSAENYIQGVQRVREFKRVEREATWTSVFKKPRTAIHKHDFDGKSSFTGTTSTRSTVRGSIKDLFAPKGRTLRKTLSRVFGKTLRNPDSSYVL